MSEWENLKLGEVLQFQRGFDLLAKDRSQGNIPVVSSSGITGYHNTAKAKKTGVVIGRKGTLGTVHFINTDYWPHDTTLWVKDFKGNLPVFIYYFLKLMKLESYDVGASNPTLNRNHLHKLSLKFPPLPIQKKIAAILSTYDDLIENNDRRITLLEKMAEEIYREWFVRLRFPGHEQVAFYKGIPDGWTMVKLDDIYQTSSGGTPSRQHPEYYGGHIAWVKTGELKNSFILDSEEKITYQGLASSSAKRFPRQTVIMAMYGATIGQLGILSIEATTNQACCAFLPKNPAQKYGYTYLLLKSIKDSLISFSFGGAQQNISQDLIKKFKVLLPTYQIIDEFSKRTESIYSRIEIIYKSQNNLKQTRDRLLTRLISGKLSVEDLDIQFPPSMTEELEATNDG